MHVTYLIYISLVPRKWETLFKKMIRNYFVNFALITI